VLIEQAIFTSAESDHAVGYHLAARSPGLDEADARELTVWGPSHDSLESGSLANAASVNFFRLPSGSYCVSKSQLAGEEYSRRGLRTYTNCLVVSPDVLARFSNNPFALLRAAWAKGLLKVCDTVPTQLVPFQLAGRAAPVDEGLIGQLIEQCGAAAIGRLIEAALGDKPVVLLGVQKPEATVAGLLNLLPLSCRRELSFTTGLKYSPRRPFHLLIATQESAELRRLFRQQLVSVVDVSPPAMIAAAPPNRTTRVDRRNASAARATPEEEAAAAAQRTAGRRNEAAAQKGAGPCGIGASAFSGWAGYVTACVEGDATSSLFDELRERTDGLHLANLNELGDHLRQQLSSSGAGNGSRKKTHASALDPVDHARPTTDDEAAHSTTDDDFLAMLLSGDPQPDADDDDEALGHEIRLSEDNASARQVHLERLSIRQAPSVLMEVENPAILERLEKLDDVVFDAISGDGRALDEMSRLWPQLVAELGPEKLEESREHYLRYSLSIWESCLEDGLRDPERAIASLHVLSVLFSDR
jgi:hypothetical protein